MRGPVVQQVRNRQANQLRLSGQAEGQIVMYAGRKSNCIGLGLGQHPSHPLVPVCSRVQCVLMRSADRGHGRDMAMPDHMHNMPQPSCQLCYRVKGPCAAHIARRKQETHDQALAAAARTRSTSSCDAKAVASELIGLRPVAWA